jgi:O-antigen/teichoic acid export membrane protein
LGVTATSGCVLVVVILLVSQAFWRGSVPVKVLLPVAIADAIMVRIIDVAAQAFLAVEVPRKSAEIYVVLSVVRTLAAVCLAFTVHIPTTIWWSVLYCVSTVAAAVYAIVAVSRFVGAARLGFHLSGPELKEGFYFAVTQSSQTTYNDIDKTMLVRFGGLEATGIYGAAYRIVDISFAPIGALVSAALARFFRHGESGITGSARFAKRLLPYAAGYGLFATVFLFAASPILPMLLGRGFERATVALQWLSPLVLLKSIHYFFANALSGAGFQGLRASIQLAIVALNVGLNLWLIPAYSWRGAAWASIASDGALAACLLLAVIARGRREAIAEGTRVVESSAIS